MTTRRSTIIKVVNKSVGELPKKFSDGSVADLHQNLMPLRGQPGPLNLVKIRSQIEGGIDRRGGEVSVPRIKGGIIQATNYGVFNPMILGGRQVYDNEGGYLKY